MRRYDASVVIGRKAIPCDASVASPRQTRRLRWQRGETSRLPVPNHQTARRVTAVRPERGYSATNYEATAVNPPKTLRRQFGRSYDVKKVRNSVKCRSAVVGSAVFAQK